ncbi:hypothetical protein SNE25_11635 [Mucilaginibacter sabulilitoris]|uniref:MFS transporter n=1 Tax=Mucilaginibacter sabulilitoris TaxID=1173583 RepID=A0ABZ0TWI3_9SPHI|nr:hypothetical protein [Mucilaginibacter sabulilitoris]WPU96169.1 hypothetical protein SNE25_11635 [Mucilaginibacter sabulilitoris]
MTNHISHMPIWAIVLFIASFLYSVVFITKPVKQAALNVGMTARKSTNIQIGIVAFYLAYLIYVSVFALKGTFDVNSLPPKVMVWAGMPLTIILFGFIGNTRLFKTLLRSISLESLIAVHVFRILGVFFILLYCYHLLPTKFAFFAGLGDIITAILAIPVAKMVSKGKSWSKPAVYAWNIFGIMDIIDLLVIAVTIGANGNLREVTVFPFVWFPAFAPATILFLHTAVFRKLNQLKHA